MLRKLTLTLLLLPALLLATPSRADAARGSAYEFALGLKIGSPMGITGKLFLDRPSAIELILHGGFYGVGLTGLYEYHVPFPSEPSLRWYYGGGAHFTMGRRDVYNPFADGYYHSVILGLDGVLGLEYVFRRHPFAIGIDVLPIINLNRGIFLWWNAGLHARYAFK